MFKKAIEMKYLVLKKVCLFQLQALEWTVLRILIAWRLTVGVWITITMEEGNVYVTTTKNTVQLPDLAKQVTYFSSTIFFTTNFFSYHRFVTMCEHLVCGQMAMYLILSRIQMIYNRSILTLS